jgi:transcriptional regulator with XRE-family HTH domain
MNNIVAANKAAIFAEEAFVVDVQSFLHHLMEEKGLSRADLAKAMGVSRARITQIFSDECSNFTVRLLARAAHAMGETLSLDCDFTRAQRELSKKKAAAAHAAPKSNVIPLWSASPGFDEIYADHCHDDERLQSFVALSNEMSKAA